MMEKNSNPDISGLNFILHVFLIYIQLEYALRGLYNTVAHFH